MIAALTEMLPGLFNQLVTRVSRVSRAAHYSCEDLILLYLYLYLCTSGSKEERTCPS